ncbi:hypothetical protein F5146DRAFT_107100 [Armillaria mellea]|nr:hypothetical protein F5146DRAFT_107100 [Armillaria mellea]
MWLLFIHPSAAIVSVRHCLCSHYLWRFRSRRAAIQYYLNHLTKRARCFPITPNTDAIFFSGRTGCRYSERPGWLLFSLFYSVHTVASPITTLRPYWISTSRINTNHVLSSPFPYPFMIRTHSFHPAFLLWLLLCFFLLVSASLTFVVLLSPPLRLCAGSPGGRAEREGAASVLMGGHYMEVMGKESFISHNDRPASLLSWRSFFIPIHPGAKVVSIIYWTIVLLLIHRYT